MCQIFDSFYSILKKRSKLVQKSDFLAHLTLFWRGWEGGGGRFLSPFFPKYDSILLTFWQEVVSYETKTVFEQVL